MMMRVVLIALYIEHHVLGVALLLLDESHEVSMSVSIEVFHEML